MSILIKDVLMLDGSKKNIQIEGNNIVSIDSKGSKSDHVLDGNGKLVLPGLINMHTHAAMTLFRGYADDMEFFKAWPEKVWPAEAKLTGKDVYVGTKLACLEMIKTGTTCFNDQYFYASDIAKAVKEMGLRALVSEVFLDNKDIQAGEIDEVKTTKALNDISEAGGDLVTPALGPHAVYTVSPENLKWIKDYSDKNNLLMHFHLSETRKENEDCVKEHGKRPTELLDDIGFLGENLIAAHCVWLTKAEVNLLAKRNVTVVHSPASNMKLATGGVMPYKEMRAAGVNITIGTDGCASNNNLDLLEELKFAALLQKSHYWSQTLLPATEAIELATVNAGKALKMKLGKIEEGYLADLTLVDLRRPDLTPNFNPASNLVYSANGSCVDTVICNGVILMKDGKVDGEEDLLDEANKVVEDLMGRV